MNRQDREETLTLELLEAIERRSDLTQRHLAGQMGVALGLANAYLKRCVRKGLVKIQQAPANRYLYYLTPKGFAEKSRLTAEYLAYSLSFYRRASESCAEALQECAARGHRSVGLYGVSDLVDVATIRASEQGMHVICVCDGTGRSAATNVPVVASVEEAPEVPIWLMTGLDDPAVTFARLSRSVGENRVVAPWILGIGTHAGVVGKGQADARRRGADAASQN